MNKNDFVHYLSAHDKITKTGIVTDFFLTALHICSPELLLEELEYITNIFTKLGHPKCLLYITEEKACQIILYKQQSGNTKYMVVPHSDLISDLKRTMFGMSIQVVAATGRKVRLSKQEG